MRPTLLYVTIHSLFGSANDSIGSYGKHLYLFSTKRSNSLAAICGVLLGNPQNVLGDCESIRSSELGNICIDIGKGCADDGSTGSKRGLYTTLVFTKYQR